jgi:hypothetical protein
MGDEQGRPTRPDGARAGAAAELAGQMRTPALGTRVGTRAAAGRQALDRAAVEGLLRVVGADGHGIYAVDALVAGGLPPALVMGLARWHRPLGATGGGVRGADGHEAGAVWGVHGLALLLAVARGLGLGLGALPTSWRQAAHGVAVALAAWVVRMGGVPAPLGPPPVPTVAPPPMAGDEGPLGEAITASFQTVTEADGAGVRGRS